MKKLSTLILLAGCSGTPRPIPEIPPVGTCQVIDPTTISSEPAKKGPGLGRLLPGRGETANLPLTVPQLLSMPEAPSEVQWRALPPGSDAVLSQIAADDEAGVPQRARAVSGLAVRKAEGAGPQIAAILANPALDGTLRRTAARALGEVYVAGGPGGGDEAHVLINSLDDPDALTREAVVQSLAAHVARADIRAALEARQAKEDNDLVKAALSKALAPKEP